MTSHYGGLWVSSFGDNVASEVGSDWARGLAGLSTRQIEHGLDAAAKSGKPMPPTLPQFRAMCLSAGEEGREATKEEIQALADRMEADDRAHFTAQNARWREAGHNDELFSLDACIFTRSRYLSDAEKTLRRSLRPRA